MRTPRALPALVLAAAVPAGAACPLPPDAGARLDAGPVQLAWRVEGGTIAVGQPFALLVTLCPQDARLVRVDATMPEHRHGMNYRPDVASLGDGRYDAKGLLFHMPGLWRLTASVYAAGQPARLTYEVEIR